MRNNTTMPMEFPKRIQTAAMDQLDRALLVTHKNVRPSSAPVRHRTPSSALVFVVQPTNIISTNYLKKAESKKKRQQYLFNASMSRVQHEQERQLEWQITSANERLSQLNIHKKYSSSDKKTGRFSICVCENETPLRRISISIFDREYERLMQSNPQYNSNALHMVQPIVGSKQSKTQIQSELQRVLVQSVALNNTLKDQLLQFQIKGWNKKAV